MKRKRPTSSNPDVPRGAHASLWRKYSFDADQNSVFSFHLLIKKITNIPRCLWRGMQVVALPVRKNILYILYICMARVDRAHWFSKYLYLYQRCWRKDLHCMMMVA